MVTAQTIEGNWNDIAFLLRERWSQLTGNEWDEAEGKIDRLIRVIQGKTGETREEIQRFLEELVESDGSRLVQRARQTFRSGLNQAEAAVQRHPGRSLAIAFGVGLAAGLLLGVSRR